MSDAETKGWIARFAGIGHQGLKIRPERASDFPAIRVVVAAAFGSDAEAELVEAIRASDGYEPSLALVALIGGRIVGHVMLSEAELRDAAGAGRPIMLLAPLAVAPDHQRLGIGGALVRAACELAERRGEPMVALEGDPAYYSRFGFQPSFRFGIELPLPDWAPHEAGQVLRLRAFDETMQGAVVYPPAFDVVYDP